MRKLKCLFFCVSFLMGMAVTIAQGQSFDENTYYRLTTGWLGEGKSLDVINDGENNKVGLAETGDFSGQYWKITELGDGYYRLTSAWQGDDKSLDVVNDGVNNQVHLAKTGEYSGQAWKIAKLGDGFYRLTTGWQGDGKSLDVVNDGKNNKVHLAETGGYSGQYWKITDISGPKVSNEEFSIQERLDSGETPMELVKAGVPVEDLYGKMYEGGLIFYLNTKDGSGLVAAAEDQDKWVHWGCTDNDIKEAHNTNIGSGQKNTKAIVGSCKTPKTAANICVNLKEKGHNDWFLPSKDELNTLYQNLHKKGIGNFDNGYYWSSSEKDANIAWLQHFGKGAQFLGTLEFHCHVRAVRSF